MDILNDASALLAVILKEPNRERVIELTKGATLVCPEMISFEVGNALINIYRRHRLSELEVMSAYNDYLKMTLTKISVDITRALRIGIKHNIYAYDAYYLELAERMDLPLVTFDEQMARAAKEMGITVLQ
jgi:predicted nucleic acid-binding protein